MLQSIFQNSVEVKYLIIHMLTYFKKVPEMVRMLWYVK